MRRRSILGVASSAEAPSALRRQPLAALGAAAGDDLLAVLGGHALTPAVTTGTHETRRLIGPLGAHRKAPKILAAPAKVGPSRRARVDTGRGRKCQPSRRCEPRCAPGRVSHPPQLAPVGVVGACVNDSTSPRRRPTYRAVVWSESGRPDRTSRRSENEMGSHSIVAARSAAVRSPRAGEVTVPPEPTARTSISTPPMPRFRVHRSCCRHR